MSGAESQEDSSLGTITWEQGPHTVCPTWTTCLEEGDWTTGREPDSLLNPGSCLGVLSEDWC